MQLGNGMARLKQLEVDLDGVTSSRDLHTVLSRALDFPFGMAPIGMRFGTRLQD